MSTKTAYPTAPKSPFWFCLILVLILYIPSIKNGYNLDDHFVTASTPKQGITGSMFHDIFTKHYIENEGGFTYEYRPLVKLSFAIEAMIVGHKPGPGHFINILLYAACLTVLYRFLLLCLGKQKVSVVNLTILLFACLPIHSEVVLSLKNRDVLLCFLFSFLAMNQLLSANKPILKYSLAAFYFSAAFLAKLDAAPFLFIAPFAVYYRQQVFSRQVIYALLLVMLGIVILFAMKRNLLGTPNVRYLEFYENPLVQQHDFSNRLMVILFATGYYVIQCFVPASMLCYYGYGTFDYFHFGLYHIAGILVITGSAWLLYRFRKNTVIVLGLFLFYAFLSMYLNIVRLVPGLIGDRFTFFLSMGLCLLVAEFLYLSGLSLESFRYKSLRGKPALRWSFLVILVLYAGLCLNRTFDWKNKFTLYETDLAKVPDNYKLNTLLATEYAQEAKNNRQLNPAQKRELALKSYKLFKTAQGIYDSDYQTLNNIGYLELYVNQQPDTAVKYLKKSLTINNRFPETYENIAEAYRRSGQTDSSIQYRKLAWIRDTKNENRLLMLYNEYLKNGYLPEARWLKDYCNKHTYSAQLKSNLNSRVY